jgi:hypothetical protein
MVSLPTDSAPRPASSLSSSSIPERQPSGSADQFRGRGRREQLLLGAKLDPDRTRVDALHRRRALKRRRHQAPFRVADPTHGS